MDEEDERGRAKAAYVCNHLAEFMEFLPKLNEESDRGMVLIGTSFVDELLKRTLRAYLIVGDRAKRLTDGFNAPLGSFATRTAAAYALGLISDQEADEADTQRKIRNRFAHEIHASFADQSMIDLCANLTMAARSYDKVVVGPRGSFATSVSALILNLTNRPHYVALQRRSHAPWPY